MNIKNTHKNQTRKHIHTYEHKLHKSINTQNPKLYINRNIMISIHVHINYVQLLSRWDARPFLAVKVWRVITCLGVPSLEASCNDGVYANC